MAQILGVATILLGGDYVPSSEGNSLEPGGMVRTTKAGDQVHGPTQTAKASKLTLRMPADAAIDAVNLINDYDGPVTFEGDNGVTYQSQRMWCLGDTRVTAGPTGEINATLEGMPFDVTGVAI